MWMFFFSSHPQLWTSDTAAEEGEGGDGGDEGQTKNWKKCLCLQNTTKERKKKLFTHSYFIPYYST